jgi:hypothetical protein
MEATEATDASFPPADVAVMGGLLVSQLEAALGCALARRPYSPALSSPCPIKQFRPGSSRRLLIPSGSQRGPKPTKLLMKIAYSATGLYRTGKAFCMGEVLRRAHTQGARLPPREGVCLGWRA